MSVLSRVGTIFLAVLRILFTIVLWLLRALFEFAKLFFILLGLVLKIVFNVIDSCADM
ncbi:MAG: hypothetical protein J6M65_05610 [Eubacterium sp.]|nr:hypothetical protein [Eubacterium sp.]